MPEPLPVVLTRTETMIVITGSGPSQTENKSLVASRHLVLDCQVEIFCLNLPKDHVSTEIDTPSSPTGIAALHVERFRWTKIRPEAGGAERINALNFPLIGCERVVYIFVVIADEILLNDRMVDTIMTSRPFLVPPLPTIEWSVMIQEQLYMELYNRDITKALARVESHFWR